MCLRSLENQEIDKEVIVSTHLSDANLSQLCLRYKALVVECKDNLTYASKVNFGAKHSTGTHLLIAQDDLILSKDCIKKMLEEVGEAETILMNPMSNCDLGRQFFTRLAFGHNAQFEVKQSLTIEEVMPFLEELMGEVSIATVWQTVGCLYTYCTLIHKKLWDALQGFDENFRNGKEDIDLSIRASALGAVQVINWNCFVLHFSGVTANTCDLTNDNKHNDEYFKKKHGQTTRFISERK